MLARGQTNFNFFILLKVFMEKFVQAHPPIYVVMEEKQ